MATVRLPKTTFNIVAAPTDAQNAPQRILIVGQQVDGTSTTDVLIKDVGFSGQEDALFGRQSMLAYMIREFRKINVVSQIDAIPLDSGAGAAAATSTITFLGTATENATLDFVIQSKKNFSFSIPIVDGDSSGAVATAVAAAINASDSILVSAANTLDDVDLTSLMLGTFGNSITIRIENLPAGITLSALLPFSGGTGDPVTTTIFDQLENIRYQTIIFPANYTKSDVVDFLDGRFNATNAVLDGIVLMSETSSSTLLKGQALALDSLSAVLLGNKPVAITNAYQGSALIESDVAISAQLGAIRTLRLTPGQNIANFLVGGSIFTTFGGTNRAALPYHNTPFENLAVIEEELGWTRPEQDDLNDNGIAFLGNNTSVNQVISGDMVTTFLNNPLGSPDKTFKFLNAVDTSSALREFFSNNNREQYAQTVLTEGQVVANADMASVQSIRAFQTKLYDDLSKNPFTLVPTGTTAVQFFNDNLSVTADFESGLITIIAIVPIVSQVRVIDGTLRISFTIQTGG